MVYIVIFYSGSCRYPSSIIITISVKVISFFIAVIFRSFINSFGILTDKCAFSTIFYILLFLHIKYINICYIQYLKVFRGYLSIPIFANIYI